MITLSVAPFAVVVTMSRLLAAAAFFVAALVSFLLAVLVGFTGSTATSSSSSSEASSSVTPLATSIGLASPFVCLVPFVTTGGILLMRSLLSSRVDVLAVMVFVETVDERDSSFSVDEVVRLEAELAAAVDVLDFCLVRRVRFVLGSELA